MTLNIEIHENYIEKKINLSTNGNNYSEGYITVNNTFCESLVTCDAYMSNLKINNQGNSENYGEINDEPRDESFLVYKLSKNLEERNLNNNNNGEDSLNTVSNGNNQSIMESPTISNPITSTKEDDEEDEEEEEEEFKEDSTPTSQWNNMNKKSTKINNGSTRAGKLSKISRLPSKKNASICSIDGAESLDSISSSSSSTSSATSCKEKKYYIRTDIKYKKRNPKRSKKVKNLKKTFKIMSAAAPCDDPLLGKEIVVKEGLKGKGVREEEEDECEEGEDDTLNSSDVVKVLKEFYVETNFNGYGLLLNVLKCYSLGPLDEFKCILCCIEKIDLCGFIERHTRKCNKYCDSSTDIFLNTTGNKFCNMDKLENVAKYVSLFNPFCEEYCKKFYPNCEKKPLNSYNINNNSSCGNNNNKTQNLNFDLTTTTQQVVSKKERDHLKCKPYFPPPPMQNIADQFNSAKPLNVSSNNNGSATPINSSSLSIHAAKQSIKESDETLNKLLLVDQENRVYENNLIGCLKGFDLTNARQHYENSKKTILNFQNLSNSTTTTNSQASYKMKCLSNDLLKYKPMPLCRDKNGNLVLNIDLNRTLSKRAHNLTKNMISNRNLKISNSK